MVKEVNMVVGMQRMLHRDDCPHTVSYSPPWPATPWQLKNLRVCYTCAGKTLLELKAVEKQQEDELKKTRERIESLRDKRTLRQLAA